MMHKPLTGWALPGQVPTELFFNVYSPPHTLHFLPYGNTLTLQLTQLSAHPLPIYLNHSSLTHSLS